MQTTSLPKIPRFKPGAQRKNTANHFKASHCKHSKNPLQFKQYFASEFSMYFNDSSQKYLQPLTLFHLFPDSLKTFYILCTQLCNSVHIIFLHWWNQEEWESNSTITLRPSMAIHCFFEQQPILMGPRKGFKEFSISDFVTIK